MSILWEFHRGHSLEDAILASGRHKDGVARIWRCLHDIAAARGRFLQASFTFGGWRPDGAPRIVELDETVVHTQRIPIDSLGSDDREALLQTVQMDNDDDDMNLESAMAQADAKERPYVLAHKHIMGVCDRDSLACAFFSLPDVYVPPGSAPPLIRAAHGTEALKKTEFCGA